MILILLHQLGKYLRKYFQLLIIVFVPYYCISFCYKQKYLHILQDT